MLVAIALVLAAAPAEPLPSIPAPLGSFTRVSEIAPATGIPSGDLPVLSKNGCNDVLYLSRAVGGVLRAIEQISGWLDKQPDLEKKLFGELKPLLEASTLASSATLVAGKSTCGKALFSADKAPAKWCPVPESRDRGDFWFMTTDGKPAAVVSVERPKAKTCRSPMISIRAFDQQGRVRLKVHLTAGRPVRVIVVGEKCQNIEFTEDSALAEFTAQMRSCKL